MRPVLLIALLALLALGLRSWQKGLETTAREKGLGQDLTLVVLARGALLPKAQNRLTEQYGVDDAVITQDLALQMQPREPGLRAALFDADFKLRAYRNFDIAGSSGDRLLFLDFCRDIREGWVLVLHNFGAILPDNLDPSEGDPALERLLASLGPRARPFTPPQSSWCFIAMRKGRGWMPLAESYSRTQGAALAFTLGGDRNLYGKGFRPDWLAESPPREASFALRDELVVASWSPKTTWLLGEVALGDTSFPALHAQPPANGSDETAKENRVRWPAVTLGAAPVFQAGVALREEARNHSDGVTFGLEVNGQPVASLPVTSFGQWHSLEADLSPFAGRTVDIEMVVDPMGNPNHDKALWGNPRLSWQPMEL